MALPLLGATFIGSIISALTLFFATRIPVILATLGLSATVYVGLDVFADQIIGGVRSAIGGASSINFMGQQVDGLGLIASAGFFDAVNIILSGLVSVGVIKSAKLYISALKP